jgi:hypothetical protein
VVITLRIKYQGPGVSKRTIATFNRGIRTWWTGKFGKYNVTTNVRSGKDNIITVPLGNARAYVDDPGPASGEWPALRPAWTAAHEAGHLMGLDDHYSNVGPDPGWAHDIMAVHGQRPSERDVKAVTKACGCP